jgi:hypothetical protein
VVLAGPDGITVSWQPPETDGGSAITGYRVTVREGGDVVDTVDAGADETSVVVTGLDAGATYTFSVAAVNEMGAGPESGESEPVQPGLANEPATGAPSVRLNGSKTALTASRGSIADGNGLGTLAWSWQRESADGWIVIPGASSTLAVTDDLRGRKVRAVASFTDGAGFTESRASAGVTVPRTMPGRPTVEAHQGAKGGPKTVEVSWTAPETTGGWPIQGYRVKVVKASSGKVVKTAWAGASARTASVKVPSGTYRVLVNAKNKSGHGPAAVSWKVVAR